MSIDSRRLAVLVSLLAFALLSPSGSLADSPSETPPPTASPHAKLTENVLTLSEGTASPPANLDQASFLVGSWTGEALGGVVDEVWAPAHAGAMMGMFRLVRDDRPSFYELFVLQEEAGSLVLRLKHFDGATFNGWEAKDETVDFPLVRVEPGTLYLDGMTLRRVGPDELTVFVALGEGDTRQEEAFRYRRVEPLEDEPSPDDD